MATTLKGRLDALPAELYRKIFELTFTTNGKIQTIQPTYKPPSCLQVSRSMRAAFAKSYYGLGIAGKDRFNPTIFYINKKDCPKWLKTLTQDHVDMLEEVRYRDYGIRLWAGSSEEVLKNVYEKHRCEFVDLLADDIGPSPVIDPAQLCVPCKDVWKGTDNWRDIEGDLSGVGEDKYRSIADLENGLWSDLVKDDVPDFD